MLRQFRLTDSDRSQVRDLLIEVCRHPNNLEESSFLPRASLLAHELPIRVREALYDFKLRESSVGLLITNNPVSPQDVGPTPKSHWRPGERRPLAPPQIMHGLYASLLGEIYGFESQQCGRIFNDLIPMRGHPPYSSSGAGNIGLHTEDCFQPYSPDYIGLLCLRNEERSATTFSSLAETEIPENIRRILWEELFAVKVPIEGGVSPASGSMLFGDPKRPYLRFTAIDPNKTTSEMASALDFLRNALGQNRQSVTLTQGDCLYLDNFLAVHGRKAYQPLDSNGRWFCRLIMSRDLRRTRALREAPETRVVRTAPLPTRRQ
jgi:hypothetical protein